MKGGWLWGPLPDTADGIPVHVDFRRWMLFFRLLADPDVPEAVKPAVAARIVCRGIPDVRMPEESPDGRDRVTHALLTFASGGEEPAEKGDPGEPLFDFGEDGERILASFRAAYGIDLTEARMHWWVFLALLRGLPPDSPFMRALCLRALDPAEIADDRMRREVRRAKRAVRLTPALRNNKEKE
ncbi:MAG: bacteriophage Gp15 family protein [Clostridiales bacterium]|nr:bacteriophage Gp15 family protein [Clostridiales bacterium]